jgi:predicted MFS family arabinose efflux permease
LPLERITMLVGGWRVALLGFGVLTLVCVLLTGLLLERLALPRERGASLSLRPIGAILSNRRCWPLLVINVINFPIYFVVQTTVGKKFLEDFGGLSSAMSASMTMLMLACCGSATVLGGFLPRRRPHHR